MGGFILSSNSCQVLNCGGEMLVKRHNQRRWLVRSSDTIPLLPPGRCHWQVNIWADFALGFFSALLLPSQNWKCKCLPLCTLQTCVRMCVHIPEFLCSPSGSMFLVCCGDLSAGSDSFPSKLHIPLPLCKLLKPDVQKGLCYDALLWADFIPWSRMVA